MVNLQNHLRGRLGGLYIRSDSFGCQSGCYHWHWWTLLLPILWTMSSYALVSTVLLPVFLIRKSALHIKPLVEEVIPNISAQTVPPKVDAVAVLVNNRAKYLKSFFMWSARWLPSVLWVLTNVVQQKKHIKWKVYSTQAQRILNCTEWLTNSLTSHLGGFHHRHWACYHQAMNDSCCMC
jgi:hypothetical protein